MKPESDDASIDIDVAWTPGWEVLNTPSSISFDNRSFETITAISRALRTVRHAARTEWKGRVISCSAEDPLLDDIGDTTIKLRVNDMRIEVRLTSEDYRSAVRAHIEGKLVRVTGILEKTSKKATLLQPEGFAVIE
jgi:hypothetical protein